MNETDFPHCFLDPRTLPVFVLICFDSFRILSVCLSHFNFCRRSALEGFLLHCTAGLMESVPRPGSAPAVSERRSMLDLSSPRIVQSSYHSHEYKNIQEISKMPKDSKLIIWCERATAKRLSQTKSRPETVYFDEFSQIFTVTFQAHQLWLQSWYCRLH